MTTMVYPNPHQGSFTMVIESPETGSAKIELFTISGQKLAEKTVLVKAGVNNVPFTGMRQGTIFYRVQVGKHSKNGKVIGIE
jgi:hypothetical protein